LQWTTRHGIRLLINNSPPEGTYHNIPGYRSRDQSKKRIPLELLHARLGQGKCGTLLAANEHSLWEDALIRMTGETGCLTCGIATICSRPRNREARLGATRPWKYLLFLDIQHPLVETGLTPGTRYSFHLLIVALLTLIM